MNVFVLFKPLTLVYLVLKFALFLEEYGNIWSNSGLLSH